MPRDVSAEPKVPARRQSDASALDETRRSLPNPERELAEKIEMLTEYAGGRKRAAEAMGVAVTTLDNYRSGATQPKFLELLRLASAAGHGIDYLLWGTGYMSLLKADAVVLPVYDQRASAGAGALVVSDDVKEYYSVSEEWLRRNLPAWAPPNAIVGILEGSGDSMEPTIRDGDLVMIVQEIEWRIVERGGIFVFSLDDERLLLKRLQVLVNGDLKIISDNPAYGAEIIPFDDIQHRVRIHGMVFFAGGKPRPLVR